MRLHGLPVYGFGPRMAAMGLAIVAIACGQPPATPARPGEPAQPSGSQPQVPTRVVISQTRDISHLSPKLGGTGSVESDFSFVVNSPLVVLDERGAPAPLLAVALPSRDRGTWTVRDDGRMETTWRIRPNAIWHDGHPLTSRDFVFALKVYLDPALEVAGRELETRIDRVEALDEKSFVVHWNQVYLRADQLIYSRLPPLPEHILGAVYESGDSGALQNSPFFTSSAYVGNGPYRIKEWEKGVRHVYQAFDQYFAGRPRIDEVIMQVISDESTTLANLLGGSVDMTGASGISVRSVSVVREEWQRVGGGEVIISPTVLRTIRFQNNPSWLEQPAILDVRVRRAIAYALDRETIAESVSLGTSPVAHTFVAPSDPLYPRVQQTIARYPYDVPRAMALLQEAGWTRTRDRLANASNETFALEIRSSNNPNDVLEKEAIASYLRALGMEIATETYRPGSLDNEQAAKLPGIQNTTIPVMDVPDALLVYATARCPTPERRYLGENRGCWSNQEFDRLFLLANKAFDQVERDNALVSALRILTEEVGSLGMSYNVQVSGIRKGLVGPGPLPIAQRGFTRNIHEWYWSQ